MYYVYILLCNDGTYYTGCTQNLKERLERHGKSYVDYTKDNLPVKLVFYCAFPDKYKAYEFEKYLKSGSGIAFRNKHFVCGFLFLRNDLSLKVGPPTGKLL